jgi:hypothetical protein
MDGLTLGKCARRVMGAVLVERHVCWPQFTGWWAGSGSQTARRPMWTRGQRPPLSLGTTGAWKLVTIQQVVGCTMWVSRQSHAVVTCGSTTSSAFACGMHRDIDLFVGEPSTSLVDSLSSPAEPFVVPSSPHTSASNLSQWPTQFTSSHQGPFALSALAEECRVVHR